MRNGTGLAFARRSKVGAVARIADRAAESTSWSPGEAQLSAATVRLPQESGHDRVPVDAVAAASLLGKVTVCPSWPAKACLVLAVAIESDGQALFAADSGRLRGDLLRRRGGYASRRSAAVRSVVARSPVWCAARCRKANG